MITIKKIKTKISEMQVDEEGILRLRVQQGAEIDEEEAMRCFTAYEKLGCRENKVLQLVDGRGSFTITREARTYAASRRKDFFNSVYKHDVPMRIFNREEDALHWLRGFRQAKNNSRRSLPVIL